MANRYAVATGNWSNTATWDGGTLPGAGDVVRPNGFTVTIDQSITVGELTDDALAPAVQGGSFVLSASNITLTCNIMKRGSLSTVLLQVNNPANNTTIIGNIEAFVSLNCANIASTGITNIIGNVTSRTGNQNAVITLNLSATSGTVNITGNVISLGTSPSNSGATVMLTGNMTVNMSGTISGGSVGVAGGAAFVNLSAAGILTGNITAIAGTLTPAIWNSSLNNNIVINSATFADGVSPIRGAVRFTTVSPTVTVILSTLSTLTLTDPSATNPPAEADVRDGVIYGGGAYEGTLVVPLPSRVSLGVATDNTVGTGIVTGTDFFNLIATDSDPVAVRLRNVATVQTVGDQFNSF